MPDRARSPATGTDRLPASGRRGAGDAVPSAAAAPASPGAASVAPAGAVAERVRASAGPPRAARLAGAPEPDHRSCAPAGGTEPVAVACGEPRGGKAPPARRGGASGGPDLPDGAVGAGAAAPIPKAARARVGPNAILQLASPMQTRLGAEAFDALLAATGVARPSGDTMIDERDAARVHAALFARCPTAAEAIARAAGRGTADYIRAHRIPPAARGLLRWLPARLGEAALSRAILAHAWTFCGTGRVTARRRRGAIHFAIAANPLVDPGADRGLQCHWHRAVFATLYSDLLGRSYDASETACCGAGAPACRFVIRRAA